jgi:hypothetical protein
MNPARFVAEGTAVVRSRWSGFSFSRLRVMKADDVRRKNLFAIHASLPKRKPRLLKSGAFNADRGWKVGTTHISSTRRQPIGSSPSQVFQPRLATPTNPRNAEILISASIHCMSQ